MEGKELEGQGWKPKLFCKHGVPGAWDKTDESGTVIRLWRHETSITCSMCEAERKRSAEVEFQTVKGLEDLRKRANE